MLPLDSFYTARCPAEWPVDAMVSNQETVLCIQVTDTSGCAVDFTDADDVETCIEETSSSSAASSSLVSTGGTTSSTTTTTTSTSLPAGWYALCLKHPGVYVAEIAIYDDQDNRRLSQFRYLQVAPSLEESHVGPITIPEVRMALWDTCPTDNTLLDDYEFTDTQIMSALRRPIDRWNETSPNVIAYTPATFPFREHWLIATIGYLMRIAAHHYRRNHLTYQAGGVSVNDKDKFNEYEQVARIRLEEYDSWMRNKKVEINVSMGYGSLGSLYGYTWGSRR